jgi:hypothetical protein
VTPVGSGQKLCVVPTLIDALLDRLEDARHERDPDAVAQLGILEAQIRHFASAWHNRPA